MKIIIAGSRSLRPSPNVIQAALEHLGWDVTEVVSGTAPGVDRAGEHFARVHNIPVKQFPADWDRLGRGAGYARNTEMAAYAEAALLFWDGVSKGTQHMRQEALKAKLKVEVIKRSSAAPILRVTHGWTSWAYAPSVKRPECLK